MASIAKIYTFWHGPGLGLWEQVCLNSFVRQGHDVTVFSYNEKLTVPAGVTIENAEPLVSQNKLFYYKYDGKGSVSGFSNIVRYALLEKRGGCWIDTDVICRQPIETSEKLRVGREDSETLNNAVIYTPPHHPVMKESYEIATAMGDEMKWGQGGPQLVTRLVLKYLPQCEVMPVKTYYPVHWRDAVSMFLLPENYQECKTACADSAAVHLYNEMFRRYRIPKTMLPPKGSYLHEIFQQSEISLSGVATMDPEMVRRLIKGSDQYLQVRRNKIIKRVEHTYYQAVHMFSGQKNR